MLKKLYRSVWLAACRLPGKISLIKVTLAETVAIRRKAPLYKNIRWTKEQQEQFDAYWKKWYGKKISSRWHKLYQAVSGEFCVEYIPEKMYTTRIERQFNDNRYAAALEDKFSAEILSAGCGCLVPETVMACCSGVYYNGNRCPITEEEAVSLLASAENVVIKPSVDTSSGRGVRVLERFPQEAEEIREILKEYGRDYIVQKKLVQHPAFAALNPTSVNSIRITTYILNGRIYHMPLAVRVGRMGKTVDNIHAGGLVVGMRDDGSLLPEAFLLGYGDNNQRYATHPENGICFADCTMPSIPQVVEAAYRVHGHMPHIGIVSWDFSVNEEGTPVLIEANTFGQSIWISQSIHGKGAFGENTPAVLKMIKEAKHG